MSEQTKDLWGLDTPDTVDKAIAEALRSERTSAPWSEADDAILQRATAVAGELAKVSANESDIAQSSRLVEERTHESGGIGAWFNSTIASPLNSLLGSFGPGGVPAAMAACLAVGFGLAQVNQLSTLTADDPTQWETRSVDSSGGQGSALDAGGVGVSLSGSAIGSEMLAPLVAAVDQAGCTSVQFVEDGRGGVDLVGIVGGEGAKQRIASAAASLDGIVVRDRSVAIAQPLCQVARVLDTRTAAEFRTVGSPHLHLANASRRFMEGETIQLTVNGDTDARKYVYVGAVLDDGMVVTLASGADSVIEPGGTLEIGSNGELTVEPPYGTGMFVLIATDQPLFGAPRTPVEGVDRFAEDLANALSQLEGEAGLAISDSLPFETVPRS